MDTITSGQILKDGNTLLSSGGNFELGFFSPAGSSAKRYVGIWYKKIPVQTVVWVANRENPVLGSTGFLRVDPPGILVLVNETNDIVWSTPTISASTRPVRHPVAELLDSGNLVVRDDDDHNPSSFAWQSFDHPTDTLLPGMKLGWNFTARLEVYLSSWKNADDPSPGDFTYRCDFRGYPQNVLEKNGLVEYRTGPWNGIRFSGIPSLSKNRIFKYGLVLNKNAVYSHYELLNDSVISRFTLSQTGVAQRLTWVDRTRGWVVYMTCPMDNCDFYGLCGPYGTCNVANSPVCGCLSKFEPKDEEGWDRADWSGGCVRRSPLSCEKGDLFLKYSGVKLPDTRNSWYNESMSLEECRKVCLGNCSCTAYSSLDISRGENGCLLWFDDLVDIRELSAEGQDIYIRMASSELENRGSKRENKRLVIIHFYLLFRFAFYTYNQYIVSSKLLVFAGAHVGRNNVNSRYNQIHDKDLELPLFDICTLVEATDNFSITNKLGEGGFGPVYKGVLANGQEIAVKRLSRTSHQGVDEFKNEVVCIAKLQHRNLVKLLGYCTQAEENMLLYEYMTNKSLDLILFDPYESTLLDWPIRLNIINGIARGLMYLHQDSRLRIIHRDLKASNILLDSEMNPKISDFGLARAFGGNETGANTSRVVGT
ncbi:G-type lectin S-receptor-like serine/threonine-protein kinase [Striga hermonthica]|uniref:non-specific serine/threonine protein kinase n=1 Tax=Striga hermonthica TaxID=68872 RepID=A0A9N7MK69_STRHE|nr:G-type lectin S-receptor-like serine/threonine-protein kinase [Striga hermonthica]